MVLTGLYKSGLSFCKVSSIVRTGIMQAWRDSANEAARTKGASMENRTNLSTPLATMSLGSTLEHAFKWGIPFSPLFAAILMMLAHAPFATPILEPAHFYLSCMAGAFAGLVICTLMRSWGRHRSQVACWLSAALLEVAWFLLLWGERGTLLPALGVGAFLVGLSTAVLLVLWLCVGQTDSVVCEVAKLAVGFGISFVLCSLFSIMPHGGIVSYLFPLATSVPLAIALRAAPFDQLERVQRKTPLANMNPARVITTSVLLASFGAGFAVLGFGGQSVEQGAGVVALLLVFCVIASAKRDALSLLRQVAMPLVTFSLCYTVLFDAGNPFAFFLAGCGALAIWLYIAPRFDGHRLAATTPHIVALLLAWIVLSAGVGLLAAHLLIGCSDMPAHVYPVALAMTVVVADFFWRVNAMVPASHAAETSIPSRAITDDDIARLSRRFSLSPRESQVARLLCDNRSIGYICTALDLANGTAKTHIRHVYEKTGVHSRSELQVLAEKIAGQDGV